MVYANAVELIFYSRKNFMSNGMKELKGFIVKKILDTPLHFGILLQGEGTKSRRKNLVVIIGGIKVAMIGKAI